MAVKIRLMRIGSKKRPFYRVVAVDERKKRTGSYLELLGTYNPLTEPHEIILKKDRIEWWTKQGAVSSDGFLRITKQAPQKPPRKPRKEQEEKPAKVASSEPAEEKPTEEIKETEETPKEAETPASEENASEPEKVEESKE